MAEIINLRQVRKAREKAEKETRAAQNRALFGRPKAAKTLVETRKSMDVLRLDGHRLESSEKE